MKTSGLEAQKLKLKVELQAERKRVVNFEKSYALKAEKEKKIIIDLIS